MAHRTPSPEDPQVGALVGANPQDTPRPSVAAVPEFGKTATAPAPRKQSVLTQMLSASSDNNTDDEDAQQDISPTVRRGFSTTSTWSNPSLTSDNGMTSPGTRTTTPSPPPPHELSTLPPAFNTKSFQTQPTVIKDTDSYDPLDKHATPTAGGEQAVEAGLGRKRCIMFACGKKESPKPAVAKVEAKPAAEPPKRKCMLSFACPSKTGSPGKSSSKHLSPTSSRKLSTGRRPSPAPAALKTSKVSPSPSPSPVHRRRPSNNTSSPSTVKSARRTSSVTRSRRLSTAGEEDTAPTERFAEYAGQRTEDDDWMKEQTCHKSRLTVNDTLKVELDLSKLGKEAEEEEEVEDEEDLDNEGASDEEDDLDDIDDDAGDNLATSVEHGSDDGFASDDEAGMEDSSDGEDSGSDYEWWTPGRSTAATSFEQIDQLHFTRQRNMSGSSIGSISSTRATSGEKRKPLKKRASIPIQKREPDLPDSTDFVCGTLDEDRPVEEAFKQEIEKRRAAKHVPCPQDIDPTFPTSDPDMDEEDDDDVFQNHEVEESDAHVDGVFGNFETHDESNVGTLRGRPRKSPAPTPPKRMRSPPPKRVVHRSPPPRRLFGQSPKRLRSPAPAIRIRSPPPPNSRLPSFSKPAPPQQQQQQQQQSDYNLSSHPIALAERPPHQRVYASSLPRRPGAIHSLRAPSPIPDADDNESGGEDQRAHPAGPTRGAIDIVKGLEKKRQFRREKLYQKYCRQRANGDVPRRREERRCQPGKGAERMREMGLELAGRWKGGAAGERKSQGAGEGEGGAQHILSL